MCIITIKIKKNKKRKIKKLKDNNKIYIFLFIYMYNITKIYKKYVKSWLIFTWLEKVTYTTSQENIKTSEMQ